jgi:chromosome partitioning protein
VVLVDTAGFGNRAASVAMTSADAVLIPALSGEADVTEAENTVRLVEGLARAARREIPARVLLNRMRRTQLARHAKRELAALPLLTSTLGDLVAYGEMTFSGRVPEEGTAAGDEVVRLMAELRGLGWIPAAGDTHQRKDMEASIHEGTIETAAVAGGADRRRGRANTAPG